MSLHTVEIKDSNATLTTHCTEVDPCHRWYDCECEGYHGDKGCEIDTHPNCILDEWFGITSEPLSDYYNAPDGRAMPLDRPLSAIEWEWDECPIWWFSDDVMELPL